ncbi:MAG: zonular occludens toxin domain-containing protein [Methylobacter sp.]
MIIFHEGLPGSGKSYEAAINQIIPALQKGRMVYAYIEGLNHEKFSEVTGLPLPVIQNLLRQLTKEQVKDVQVHVANDSLVIIDELQDFFPAGKATLDPGITEFVTQHRHRGIDIICMGQDSRDCHMLWKRRIDTLIRFVKRDAIGQPDAYTWTTYKQQSGKFVQLRSGKGTYDKKNFGLYASHTEGVSSIDAHKDDRTNVLKSAAFTFYIPLFLFALVFAVYYLYGFLSGRSSPVKASTAPSAEIRPSTPEKQEQSKAAPPQPAPQPKPPPPSDTDYLEKYLTEYRPRLVALIEDKKKNKMVAHIEFIDTSNRVFERLNIPQIVAFGYVVERKPYGLLLRRGDKRYPVTSFPIERSEGVTRHPEDSRNFAAR